MLQGPFHPVMPSCCSTGASQAAKIELEPQRYGKLVGLRGCFAGDAALGGIETAAGKIVFEQRFNADSVVGEDGKPRPRAEGDDVGADILRLTVYDQVVGGSAEPEVPFQKHGFVAAKGQIVPHKRPEQQVAVVVLVLIGLFFPAEGVIEAHPQRKIFKQEIPDVRRYVPLKRFRARAARTALRDGGRVGRKSDRRTDQKVAALRETLRLHIYR